MGVIFAVALAMYTAASPDEAGARVISGQVREKGTRAPLAGIPIVLRGADGFETEVLSDGDGGFVFTLATEPGGPLTLDVFVAGYEPLFVTVDPERHDALDIVLVPSGLSAYRTVVAAPRPPRAANVVALEVAELGGVAGTFGDPTRVVGALPGVARPVLGLGDLAVRGANPEHTGTFIDGHPTPYLYHLLAGPGVIEPGLVRDLAFYPGGSPVLFGRVAAAVVSVTTADAPTDRWHLDVHLDLLKAGVLFTTPFDEARGNLALSVRKSWMELVLPLLADGLELGYTDYQARVAHAPAPGVRLTLTVMGAVDHAAFVEGAGAWEERVDVALGFHRAALGLELDLSRCLTWTTRVMGERATSERRVTEAGSPDIVADDASWTVHALSFLQWRAARRSVVTFGLDLLGRDTELVRHLPTGTPLGEPTPVATDWVVLEARRRANELDLAGFVGAELTLADGLVLVPGLRIDPAPLTIDPRLALRWTFAPRWTLAVMGAVAHQPASVETLAEPHGAKGAPPIEAHQASLGLEWHDDDWSLSLTGYAQWLADLSVPSDAVGDDDGWRHDGRGRAAGVELFVRKRLGERVHGWLSYTLGRAERREGDGAWRLFTGDQTHVLNLATTIRLGAEWSLGLRFQLASGRPHRAVVKADYDADGDRFVPRHADGVTRLAWYHRLDLRVDKTFRFDDWMLQLYLDIQNVYAADNPESIAYAYDYSRSRGALSLPLLPTFGLRMVF